MFANMRGISHSKAVESTIWCSFRAGIDPGLLQTQDPAAQERLFYIKRLAFKMIRSASTSVIITVIGSTGEVMNP